MTQELEKESAAEIDLDTMTATRETLEDYTLRFAPRKVADHVLPAQT